MNERWAVEGDTGAELTVRAPNGFAVELDANSTDPRERFAYFAIRQLLSDLAERDARIAELTASRNFAMEERDGWIVSHAQLFRKIGNLLAVIHRDGGHYQSEHGLDKAIADAHQRICDTRVAIGAADELAMLVRRLAHALQKSAPDSGLPKTAMDYLSIAGLAGSTMRAEPMPAKEAK
jgi:hypothetical protein